MWQHLCSAFTATLGCTSCMKNMPLVCSAKELSSVRNWKHNSTYGKCSRGEWVSVSSNSSEYLPCKWSTRMRFLSFLPSPPPPPCHFYYFQGQPGRSHTPHWKVQRKKILKSRAASDNHHNTRCRFCILTKQLTDSLLTPCQTFQINVPPQQP